MEDIWISRDLPVLEAVIRARDNNIDDLPTGASIAAATGFSDEVVEQSLYALKGEYVDLRMVGGGSRNWFITDVAADARRIVGQWPSPSDLADRLVSALTAAADQETDPEKQSKLRKAVDTLGGAARDILVDVAAATITGRGGLAAGG
jgi:hypothetical protein